MVQSLQTNYLAIWERDTTLYALTAFYGSSHCLISVKSTESGQANTKCYKCTFLFIIIDRLHEHNKYILGQKRNATYKD